MPAFIAVALVALAAVTASGPQIPDDLWRHLRENGQARVIVKIAHDAATGETVADAQEAVLKLLSQSRHRVLRRYSSSPFLALEIGVDALVVLQGSPKVESVVPDVEVEFLPNRLR